MLLSHRDRSGCSGPILKMKAPSEASFHCRSDYVNFSSVQRKFETLQASKENVFDFASGFTASEACCITSVCCTEKKLIYSEWP